MSAAKHTPGPWRLSGCGQWSASHDGIGSSCYEGISDEFGNVVALAVAHDSDYFSKPDPDANARLIAVAPELLAELIICRHDLARQAAELRCSVTVPGTEEILDDEDRSLCEFEESRVARLDALIAKATGAKP